MPVYLLRVRSRNIKNNGSWSGNISGIQSENKGESQKNEIKKAIILDRDSQGVTNKRIKHKIYKKFIAKTTIKVKTGLEPKNYYSG